MISERLKNDVLFISVDGALGNDAEIRLKLQYDINSYLKHSGLQSLILCPYKKYGDISMIPYFGLSTDFENESYNYSFFLLKHLITYIESYKFSHICIWQTDGYPINLNNWDDSFLDYDFIGNTVNDKDVIMNGGFSLRSKFFLNEVSSNVNQERVLEFYSKHGHNNEDMLSQSLGLSFKYPPGNVLQKFSSRISNHNDFNLNNSFGFHWDGSSYEQRRDFFTNISVNVI